MSESTLVRPRRRWRSIVTGIACFVFGSMLVVQADPLPEKKRVGLVDANDDTNAVRVTGDGKLETADSATHDQLDQVINAVRGIGAEDPIQVSLASGPLTVNMPDGVTVNNLPATQAVTGSVAVSNLPATQAVTGGVNITNQPYVYVLPTNGMPLKAEVTIPGYVFTKAADDLYPFELQLDFAHDRPHPCVAFEVPAGSRLVTETITTSGQTPNHDNAPSIRLLARSAGRDMKYAIATNFTPPYDRYHTLDDDGEFSATHSVKLRLDSGIHLACMFGANGDLSISGYLR